jgi:hypothetical protein
VRHRSATICGERLAALGAQQDAGALRRRRLAIDDASREARSANEPAGGDAKLIRAADEETPEEMTEEMSEEMTEETT